MKKLLGLLVLCFFAVMNPANAEQSPSPSDLQFSQWMTYYYFYKDSDGVDEFLRWMQDKQLLEQKNSAYEPMATFVSAIFLDNPTQVKTWATSSNFTGKTKNLVEYALWSSGNGALINEIFKESPDYIKSNPAPLLNSIPKTPADLDKLWAGFMATGDTAYVKKIIDVLDENTLLTGDKTADLLTRGSAEWSLGSNMVQHETVDRFVRKEVITRSGAIKQKLEEIIAQNKKGLNPWPTHDGDFSAMLLVTDEKELKEYKKPETE